MTEKTITPGPAGNPDTFVWWCRPCRSTGLMYHCSDPNGCGSMERIPYAEAEKLHAAIRKARGQHD